MAKTDRRVERTRELLQKALIELIAERGYDAITIQDIVDRANIGRTTFYLHYNSKDELFMSCHEDIVSKFHIGLLHPLSRKNFYRPRYLLNWNWRTGILKKEERFYIPYFRERTAN
jgi:AcrR family transcriptional regulator